MASPLYYATILDKKQATVKVELSIVHPDVSEFGTDRLFAWKLLHEYVAGADDGTDVELASRYVRDVKLSPVKNAKVEKKHADFLRVKRAGRKNPTVIYTIDLTDASLLADVSKGDGDEVYDYVEPGKGKALTAPPKGKPKKDAAKAAAKPVDTGEKTYADFRDAALALLAKNRSSWSEYLLRHKILQRWAAQAREDEIAAWVEHFDPNEQARALALVALEREDLHASLLKRADAKHDPKDEYGHYTALQGLVPAWWKYGKSKQAEAGFQFVAAAMKEAGTEGNQYQHTLFSLAALGGQWDKAAEIAKQCFADSDYREDIAVPGIVAAYAAGQKKLFDAIMKRWTATDPSSKADDLSLELLRVVLGRGEPEKYFDLLFAWPQVIDNYGPAYYALAQVEAKDKKKAVAIADKLLADPDDAAYMHVRALSVLARHAPDMAKAWLKKNKPTIGYAAAAGQDVRKQLKKASDSEARGVGPFTTDREVAIEALVKSQESDSDANAWALSLLASLGARDEVDAILEKKLAKIAKLATKARDLPCRYLARAAVQAGRADIGFAAIKLPGPAMRKYSAGDMVRAAVEVGDFTSALAALQLIPDDDANGRVSSAIQALCDADRAFANGPYAVPVCAIDGTYVRALIALKARGAIENVLAIAPDRIPDDVRVEVDAFLEGRAFAPR